MKVACIIPAYNEASRVRKVLEVARACGGIHEILLVDDGSTDGTSLEAVSVPDVRVYRLPENVGKGAAMRAGALLTDADVLLFLDADLVNLKVEHVQALLDPVVRGEAAMSIGVFRGGRLLTDLAQRVSPNISGQRAVHRNLFIEVPRLHAARMDVEVRINRHGKRRKWPIRYVPLYGVTHPMKEEKLGLLRGLAARARMYLDIVSTVLLERWSNGSATTSEPYAFVERLDTSLTLGELSEPVSMLAMEGEEDGKSGAVGSITKRGEPFTS